MNDIELLNNKLDKIRKEYNEMKDILYFKITYEYNC